MTAPADNTLWRTSSPDTWVDDTSDVLHCTMPPQVRQHIEELRAEVRRLTLPRDDQYSLCAATGPFDYWPCHYPAGHNGHHLFKEPCQ